MAITIGLRRSVGEKKLGTVKAEPLNLPFPWEMVAFPFSIAGVKAQPPLKSKLTTSNLDTVENGE